MKNVRNKLVGASMAASTLMMASFSQAAFTVAISTTGSNGGYSYYNITAVNNGNTGGNNTGTQLEVIDSTITSVGTGTTGAILVNLQDLDGDGANDANVVGVSPDTATSTVGSYERIGTANGFALSNVYVSSTQLTGSTPAVTTTDPGGTGSPTRSIDPAFTNNTVHALEIVGTNNVADTSALVIAHVVVPTGTTGTVSGTVGGDLGNVSNFSLVFPAVTGHNIVSLTGTAISNGGNYGNGVGNLTVSGDSKNDYNVSSTSFTGVTAGYSAVTFSPNPTTGTEVYALKFTGSTGATQDGLIAAAINAQLPTGETASSIANSPYGNQFGFADGVVITETVSSTTSPQYLGFDLSQTATASGVTVSGVAAVPEPATAAGLVIGAVGLLLGRRKARLA